MLKFESIIDKLFDTNKKFNKEDFLEFISDLTWKFPDNLKKSKSTDVDWNEYVREDISIYEDSNNEKMAIMIYQMPSIWKVEKARNFQRNLISNYLKNNWVFSWVDSVLVAFYSEESSDWRLSFVKQEFKLEEWKVINELTPAKRYSFLIESDSRNITVKQRLNDLLNSNKYIWDIEKAFSVEKVSKDFFDKYVKLYEKLSIAFSTDKVFLKIQEESNNWDDHFRENFVKKLMWQIVFLYFLQKKWWLWVEKDAKWGTWKKRFLQDLLEECLNWWDNLKELWWNNFFNDYLEHLFYDNLNLKRDNDYSEYFKCKIPYLNWGLFEPINSYNWQWLNNILLTWEQNNQIFKEIFDTFDEYNFTVYENDPLEQDVAVDPEMLGKVFENLLPENERKGKWAFYTPREIVHYMCKESLKNHIINKTWITEELVEKLFTYKDSYLSATKRTKILKDDEKYNIFETFFEYWEKIIEILKNVKIVDPAVGSWAFPMWLLKEIVSLRKFIQENVLLEENVSEYNLKKETLENCIYWVDLDPGAVEIAKLRFWLSLVIEEEATDTIEPLPNLDYKIMQGNSLIEDIIVWDTIIKLDIDLWAKKIGKKEERNIWAFNQTGFGFFTDENEIKEVLKKLKYLHKVFFREKDSIKKKEYKTQIDFVEKELIRLSWESEVNKFITQIENIKWKYLLSWIAWDERDTKKVADLMSKISSIKVMEEKYKRDNIRSFFPWKLHFWEVFNDNWGFDIVIWNPPYVRHEEITEFKNYFKFVFKDFFHWRSDLYTYFYKKGHELLRNNWILSFITSNKFFIRWYWLNLREYLSEKLTLLKLINFWELPVFKASVDSAILILKNELSEKNNIFKSVQIKKEEDIKNVENTLTIKWIDLVIGTLKKDEWVLENPLSLMLLNKLRHWKITLDKYFNWKIFAWIKSWYDEAFVIDESTKNDLILEDNNSINLIKPWFKWRDLWKWKSYTKNLYVIYIPLNKISIDDYPAIKKHLFKFKDRLSKRATKQDWFEMQQPQEKFTELFHQPKIIYPDCAKEMRATFDDKNSYWTMSMYFLPFDSIILWILNSRLFDWYSRMSFATFWDPWKWGRIIFKSIYMKNVPIPQFTSNNTIYKETINNLVNQILQITKEEDYLEREDLQKQVKILESRIDDMVYKLYELTPEEIKLVKDSLK